MTIPGKWNRHQYKSKQHYANVKKHERDGFTFDSKKELARYDDLVLLRRSGEVIQFLTHNPVFRLPGGGRYTADFLVFWADGSITAEDVKGNRTDRYKAMKRIVEAMYAPITIEEL